MLYANLFKHPALRVTKSQNLFKTNRFFCEIALKIYESSKKNNFFTFCSFSKKLQSVFRIFTPQIIYKEFRDLAQMNRLKNLS